MANTCLVTALLAAKSHEQLVTFLDLMNGRLQDKLALEMGYPESDVSDYEDVDFEQIDDELFVVNVSFSLRWSIALALEDKSRCNESTLTIKEACAKYGVGIRMFSEEPGFGFCELVSYNNTGENIQQECVDYISEYSLVE